MYNVTLLSEGVYKHCFSVKFYLYFWIICSEKENISKLKTAFVTKSASLICAWEITSSSQPKLWKHL